MSKVVDARMPLQALPSTTEVTLRRASSATFDDEGRATRRDHLRCEGGSARSLTPAAMVHSPALFLGLSVQRPRPHLGGMDPAIEHELPGLLANFYGRVQQDPELGPVFAGAVSDWPAHLATLADFWSTVLLAKPRYKGNPGIVHRLHKGTITPAMFDRWLALWKATTDELLAPDVAVALQEKAGRMAVHLRHVISA